MGIHRLPDGIVRGIRNDPPSHKATAGRRMTNAEGMSNDIMRSPRRASRIGEHTACPERQSNGRPVRRGTDSPWRTCGSLRPRDDELLWEVRDGGTPSPAPETGALPSNVNKFCSAINHSFVTVSTRRVWACVAADATDSTTDYPERRRRNRRRLARE